MTTYWRCLLLLVILGLLSFDCASAQTRVKKKKKARSKAVITTEEASTPSTDTGETTAGSSGEASPATGDGAGQSVRKKTLDDGADTQPRSNRGRSIQKTAEPGAEPRRRSGAQDSRIIPLRLPPGTRVKSVSLSLEGEDQTVVEDQSAEEPDSIVNIGWTRDTTVGFDKSNQVLNKKKLTDHIAIFFLFSGVISVREFEITPSFFKHGDELVDNGRTPAMFRMEVLELNRIGDVEGRIVKVLDRVAFTLGEPNRIPLDVEIQEGKKVGVRLAIPGDMTSGQDVLLQVKASKKGRFAVRLLADDEAANGKESVRYQPHVKFAFVPRKGDIETFSNTAEGVAAKINRYLERNAAQGGDVEIPLRLKVELR